MSGTSPTRKATSMANRMAVGLIVIAGLYFGRDILIPIALAILLSFMLAPVVTRLERLGLPGVLSVVAVVGLCFAGIGGVGFVVTNQVLDLATRLPQHRENLKERLRLVVGSGGGALGTAADMVGELQAELQLEADDQKRPSEADEPGARPPFDQPSEESFDRTPRPPRDAQEPVRVRIVGPPRTTLERLADLAGPLLGPLVMAGIVIVLVTFFLLQRRDLRDRIMRLVGEVHLDVSTQAFNDAGLRIKRYLAAQLALSASFGAPVAAGLWLIGVPGALLWGVLAMLLRFVPYVGPWLSAVLPVLLSFAVFEGWAKPLSVMALFIGLELFSNNVLEPWLYGTSTGMSAVAVIMAAVFWGWIWGPIGVLLSVPLTVCFVVLGKYVPKLEVFSILLGREPALDPASRFYQRLLALDDDEAGEIASEYIEERGLGALYDDMLLPALHFAERDRHFGRIDVERGAAFVEELRLIIEEVCGWSTASEPPAPGQGERVVLCLPARDEADELAAGMLAHLLRSQGQAARALSVEHLTSEFVEEVRECNPPAVCISAVPPVAIAHSRYLCLRLSQHFPDLRIVVGLWGWRGDMARATARLRSAGAGHVATDFAQSIALMRGSTTVPPLDPPAPRA